MPCGMGEWQQVLCTRPSLSGVLQGPSAARAMRKGPRLERRLRSWRGDGVKIWYALAAAWGDELVMLHAG